MGGDQLMIVTLSAETQTNIIWQETEAALTLTHYKWKVKNTCSIIYFSVKSISSKQINKFISSSILLIQLMIKEVFNYIQFI